MCIVNEKDEPECTALRSARKKRTHTALCFYQTMETFAKCIVMHAECKLTLPSSIKENVKV